MKTAPRSASKARQRAARPAVAVPVLARIIPIEAARPRDVRWSRIATARARIASGWYERDDVQSRLADAVLEELDQK